MERFDYRVHSLPFARTGKAQFDVQPQFFQQSPAQMIPDFLASPVAMIGPGGERLKDSAVEGRLFQRQHMVDHREMVAAGAGQMERGMTAAGHQHEVRERSAVAVVAPLRMGEPRRNQQQVAATEQNGLARKAEFTATLKLKKEFRFKVIGAAWNFLPHPLVARQNRSASLAEKRIQRGQKPLFRPAPVGIGKVEFGQCKRCIGHGAPFGE